MIVVDTNLLVQAVLPNDKAELVELVARRDPSWLAPPFWRLEFANVLATHMRLRGVSIEDAMEAFSRAAALVTDAPIEPSARERLELAARGGVSAYDAEFVFVAQHLDLLLVTADRNLTKAFPGRAVSIDEFASGRPL